jgi:hypothetical protein
MQVKMKFNDQLIMKTGKGEGLVNAETAMHRNSSWQIPGRTHSRAQTE